MQTVSQKPVINPHMVVLARESRGLTQSQLAKLLKIPQSRISMIEAGSRPLSDDLMEKLVEILQYPPQHFYQAGVINGIGIPEIFHRKRQSVSQSVLMRLYALIEIRLIHLQTLVRSMDLFDCSIKPMDIEQFNEQVEEIARAVRVQLQLSRGPITDLTDVLESAGVVVWRFDFGTPLVDAVTRWLPQLPPVFFVNSQAPTDRLRFSMAHELGHIVMHTGNPLPEMEEQADRFASEFLMPERDINFDFNKVDLAQLAILKRYWRVSMAALLKRAETLHKVSPTRVRTLWIEMSKAGYRTREPIDLDPSTERPSLVREMLQEHTDHLGYSEDDLLELLPLVPNEFRGYYVEDPSQRVLRLVR